MPARRISLNILVVGNFADEELFISRALPSRNTAEANRLMRLSMALRAVGAKTVIASPATAMRIRWTGSWWHRGGMRRIRGIPVLFACSLGIPMLTLLTAPLILMASILNIRDRFRPDAVLLYNYYPATLAAGIVCRTIFRSRIIFDIEDVCIPSLSDWLGRGDPRPLHQLLGRGLLQIGLAMSDCIMVPTRRFIAVLGIRKAHLIVSGCIDVPAPRDLAKSDASDPIRILISGQLDEEQGVFLAFDAIHAWSQQAATGRPLVFCVCGHAPDERAIRERISSIAQGGTPIEFLGSLNGAEYRATLEMADVCLALQNPLGRHGQIKTPSKVYEYLANGKIVIATDVGDFSSLPSDMIQICDYSVSAVHRMLVDISANWCRWADLGRRAAAFSRREFSLASVGRRILDSIVEHNA